MIGFAVEGVKLPAERRGLLRPGGWIATALQPRSPDVEPARAGAEIAAQLVTAGFADVRLEILALEPAVVCALAGNEPRADLRTVQSEGAVETTTRMSGA